MKVTYNMPNESPKIENDNEIEINEENTSIEKIDDSNKSISIFSIIVLLTIIFTIVGFIANKLG